MIRNILIVALIFLNLSMARVMAYYLYFNLVLDGAAQTLAIDFVQQRALYEECMSLTYHTTASIPVNRILLNEKAQKNQ